MLCPQCKGKGIIIVPLEDAAASVAGEVKTCPECNGTGIVKKTREK